MKDILYMWHLCYAANDIGNRLYGRKNRVGVGSLNMHCELSEPVIEFHNVMSQQ